MPLYQQMMFRKSRIIPPPHLLCFLIKFKTKTMHICRENYLNQKRRLMRRNSSEPFTNRFLVRWVLKYWSGHHCIFVVCLFFSQTDNKCSVYNRTCRFVPMNLEESWRTFWPSVSRTRIAEALEWCTVTHIKTSWFLFTDSQIKTKDGFSLETCRSMIALMDVSSINKNISRFYK